MSLSSPAVEQLIENINTLFFSGTSEWLNNLTESNIEALFLTAVELENQIKTIMEGESGTREEFDQQLFQRFRNKNCCLSDFEMACDVLLTVFFTNSKHITGTALSKVIHVYTSIFPVDRFEKLFQKFVAQCAMANIALTVMADCVDSDNAERKFYSVRASRELPMLVDRGKCGFPAATTLIQEMMVKNVLSLEALLEALLLYEDNSIVQLFVEDTIVKTLEKVDDNYSSFWKLLVKLKEKSLVPKLADKFPSFLLSLEMFITCCGNAMNLTEDENLEPQLDCQHALLHNEELVVLIKSVVNSGGPSGNYIKKAIKMHQQRALEETDSDHRNVWIELGKACF